MKVKVTIDVPIEELAEYLMAYAELNDNIVKTPDEAKSVFIDEFLANRGDYLDEDNITVNYV